MAKYVYPAIISAGYRDDDGTYHDDGVYYVNFPDVEGCFTDGASMAEAMENATDALNCMMCAVENPNPEFPMQNKIDAPTPIERIKKEHDSDIVTLIFADTVAYRERMSRENNPIKYARQKAGMKIKDLAEMLGAPYRTVQDWNTGKRFPPKWVERLIVEKIESLA